MTDDAPRLAGRDRLVIAAAVLLALAARLPGVFWGQSFPGGFRGHHVDEWTHVVNAEVMIDPKTPPRWHPNPYPKGLAAHVAVPVLVQQRLSGRDFGATTDSRARVVPPDETLILAGRVVSVVYGALSVAVLWILARRLTGSPAGAGFAALLLALGGLHVSQSHFFVADVPATFWTLLGTHLLLVDLDARGRRPLALPFAAFALGVAAGLKLAVYTLPSLAIVTLAFPGRILRVAQAAAFALCGAVLVNFASFTPVDLVKVLGTGIVSGATYAIGDVVRIYGVELLASIGAPVVILAALGLGAALRSAFARGSAPRVVGVASLILLPAALQMVAMARKLDPFPRHLLPVFPWLVLLAGVALAAIAAGLRERPGLRAVIVGAVFAWQLALVLDGERRYLDDPRDAAMRFIDTNVPAAASVSWAGYEQNLLARGRPSMLYFDEGRPDFVIAEMYALNHYLSGAGLRESYPTDPRTVFDVRSKARMDAFQDLWRGRAGYVEVARFGEGYLMPELRFADRLLGNRSRNYLTEVVVFRRNG